MTAHGRAMAREMTVADLVSDARARAGYTVRQLAPMIKKESGRAIGPSYVTDLEKGRGIPSDHVARELARVLGMDEDGFLAIVRKQRSER